jgi:hypothetical protein
MINLDFLNLYWKTCGESLQHVGANKHFTELDHMLIKEIGSCGIREDTLNTKYKFKKRWDMHFPEKKVAIEYKTISDTTKCGSHRVEEALGAAVDLKEMYPDYKLGYILVVVVRDNPRLKHKPYSENLLNRSILSFEKMVEGGWYDYFCPIMTHGIGKHRQMRESYTLEKMISDIRDIPSTIQSPLTLCMVD